jgi:hypothetical protein
MGPGGGETRFHAARLFARYFLRRGLAETRTGEDVQAQELAAWDAATACLALSVKVAPPHARRETR